MISITNRRAFCESDQLNRMPKKLRVSMSQPKLYYGLFIDTQSETEIAIEKSVDNNKTILENSSTFMAPLSAVHNTSPFGPSLGNEPNFQLCIQCKHPFYENSALFETKCVVSVSEIHATESGHQISQLGYSGSQGITHWKVLGETGMVRSACPIYPPLLLCYDFQELQRIRFNFFSVETPSAGRKGTSGGSKQFSEKGHVGSYQPSFRTGTFQIHRLFQGSGHGSSKNQFSPIPGSDKSFTALPSLTSIPQNAGKSNLAVQSPVVTKTLRKAELRKLVASFTCQASELFTNDRKPLCGFLKPPGQAAPDLKGAEMEVFQFDAIRLLRENLIPSQLRQAIIWFNETRAPLNRSQFISMVSDINSKFNLCVSMEGLGLLFDLCDLKGLGLVEMEDFVLAVFGEHGTVLIRIESVPSAQDSLKAQIAQYKRDLKAALKNKEEVTGSLVEGQSSFETAMSLPEITYSKESVKFVQVNKINYNEKLKSFQSNEKPLFLHELPDESARLIWPWKSRFSSSWSRTHKGIGVTIDHGMYTSKAICNLMNQSEQSCSVRTQDRLPTNLPTYVEFVFKRPEISNGESLDGGYCFGLTTAAMKKYDGSWTHERDLSFHWALCVNNPNQYSARWSRSYKAGHLVVELPNSTVATYEQKTALKSGPCANLAGSVRAEIPLPRGTSFFEITIKMQGKGDGESLGGNCYVGICSSQLDECTWEGDWSRDDRNSSVWALCDNQGGILDASCLKLPEFDLSEMQVKKKLQKMFHEFDAERSGTISKQDLYLAMVQLQLCNTDEQQKITTLSLEAISEDERLDYSEFVTVIKSRAVRGMLYHRHPVEWVPNSFFGSGDVIGFKVESAKKCATIYKNGAFLGQAFANLPDTLYPFVTLSKPGMSAILTVREEKAVSTRGILYNAGLRKQWIEGSEMCVGDKLGLLVDPSDGSAVLYKNGELIGRIFDRLPDAVYPFASLCHVGSSVSLSFPPQPNPIFVRKALGWLNKNACCVEQEVPSHGCAVSLCGVQFDVRGATSAGASQKISLRVVDSVSLFNEEVFAWCKARIVSPIIEIVQIFGQSFGCRGLLTIPHYSSSLSKLVCAYVPLPGTKAFRNNVWHALETTDMTQETISVEILSGNALFAVFSFEDPSQSLDVVHLEYRFEGMNHYGGQNRIQTLISSQSSEMLYGSLKVGSMIRASVTILPRCCVDPKQKNMTTTRVVLVHRGMNVSSINAHVAGADDDHAVREEEVYPLSGCVLRISRPLQTDAIWDGRPITHTFHIHAEALELPDCYECGVWCTDDTSRAGHEWQHRFVRLDYVNGVLMLGPSTDHPAGLGKASSWMQIGRLTTLSASIVNLEAKSSADIHAVFPHCLQMLAEESQHPTLTLAFGSKQERRTWLSAFRSYLASFHRPHKQEIQMNASVSYSYLSGLNEKKSKKEESAELMLGASILDVIAPEAET